MVESFLTMPIIKSAIKKLKQSLKKRDKNRGVKRHLKDMIEAFKEKPTNETFSQAASALDKAAKTNVIHKNKAARLKSRLSKRLPKAEAKTEKKAAPKKSPVKIF